MPIYEYVCDACGHELEALQKISEDPLRTCPECAKEALRKKVSAAAFRLKGSGWYETDFKSGNKKNLAGEPDKKSGEKAETASKDSKSESKAESKSESKSESKPAKSDSSSNNAAS